MQIKEAYELLESNESMSDEDIKRTYRTLAKKYHPDTFKSDPDKFKHINEAYQLIQDYRANPDKYSQKQNQGGFWNNVVDLGEIFFNQDFFKGSAQQPLRAKPIQVNIDLTFNECVLGVVKEVSYTRNIKCKECDGEGEKHTGNGCSDCDGFGRQTKKNGGMVFQAQCAKCKGKDVKHEKCSQCKGNRVIEDKVSGNIEISPGTPDGSVMRIQGQGHFIGKSFFSDTYTDAFVNIKVAKHDKMSIVDQNVVSSIDITLLQALEGLTAKIDTVYGPKEIIISAKSKNGDKIDIANCGIQRTNGIHQVNLNVNYPDDIASIIGVLKNAIHD